jgi:hypothetical protein
MSEAVYLPTEWMGINHATYTAILAVALPLARTRLVSQLAGEACKATQKPTFCTGASIGRIACSLHWIVVQPAMRSYAGCFILYSL